MADVFRKCCLPIVLLAFVGWMIEIPNVEASCSEGLGLCGEGNSCQERCSTKHGPSSQGSCDHSISPPLCTCYYDCGTPSPPPPPPSPPPPPPKMCNGSGGLCNLSCTDQCCNNRCASWFNLGQGHCDNSAGTWLCQCQYTC